MHKKRLLKLADLLEENAANRKGAKFDIGDWGSSSSKEMTMTCGTQACALGLAAISGVFKKQGLSYHTHKFLYYDKHHCPSVPNIHIDVIFTRKDGTKIFGFQAAEDLFDIDTAASFWLFSGDGLKHQTGAKAERAAAKRIRKFVADGLTS